MNAAVLLSACVAVLQLGIGILLLPVSRAPGWSGARVFSVIAFSAAGYSAMNITTAYVPLSDAIRAAGARTSFLMAGVFIAAWLVQAYGDGTGRWHRVPTWARRLAGAVVAGGVVSAVTGWSIVPGAFSEIDIAWAGVRYRFATQTTLGNATAFLDLAAVLCVGVSYMRRRRESRRSWEYLIGFSVFIGASAVEALVGAGMLDFFFMADIGFLAVVIPMAAETVRRFVQDAQRLAATSTQLTEEIEIRTQERDEAQLAWIEAERQASVGRLAAGVGHEINNPLAYLRLNVELIGEWGREHAAPPDLMESVDSALDGADRIRRVVDALRAYSRQGTGKLAPVAPEAVTQSALRVATHQLRGAEIDLVADEAPLVMGEEAKLVQVVVNLLLNASQAIAEGATGRKGVITVRVGAGDAGQARISVGDNGPGISREDLRRLTQPYFTTRANAGAMGLGLFLARGVVEQHGGSLHIDSTQGAGTTVHVLLPAASEATASALEPVVGRVGAPRPVVSTSPARGVVVGH